MTQRLQLPNIRLELEDAGTLGSQPCSTLTILVQRESKDLQETMETVLRLGAGLRPGPKFGRQARALVIRANLGCRFLPLGFLIATGQTGRQLIETAQKHNPDNDPVTLWIAGRNGVTTTARRINSYVTPLDEKRDELTYMGPKRTL